MIRPFESAVGSHLNSVWLEGTLVSDPVDLDGRNPGCCFHIKATQSWEPAPVFLVEASDSAFDGCRPRIVQGLGVRIIGRLHQDRWRDQEGRLRKEVKIVGEMVEPLGLPL
jgi:single-strand DNA-binding protein